MSSNNFRCPIAALIAVGGVSFNIRNVTYVTMFEMIVEQLYASFCRKSLQHSVSGFVLTLNQQFYASKESALPLAKTIVK